MDFGHGGESHLKVRNLVPALLISAALLGCSQVDIPLGVTIRSPNDGASLVVGESFRVIADSDTDQPPDQATTFEVELVRHSVGYEAKWQLERVFGSEPHILDETFLVPLNAPAGEDYTLSVSVVLPGTESDQPRYRFRDAIEVRVSGGP